MIFTSLVRRFFSWNCVVSIVIYFVIYQKWPANLKLFSIKIDIIFTQWSRKKPYLFSDINYHRLLYSFEIFTFVLKQVLAELRLIFFVCISRPIPISHRIFFNFFFVVIQNIYRHVVAFCFTEWEFNNPAKHVPLSSALQICLIVRMCLTKFVPDFYFNWRLIGEYGNRQVLEPEIFTYLKHHLIHM